MRYRCTGFSTGNQAAEENSSSPYFHPCYSSLSLSVSLLIASLLLQKPVESCGSLVNAALKLQFKIHQLLSCSTMHAAVPEILGTSSKQPGIFKFRSNYVVTTVSRIIKDISLGDTSNRDTTRLSGLYKVPY